MHVPACCVDVAAFCGVVAVHAVVIEALETGHRKRGPLRLPLLDAEPAPHLLDFEVKVLRTKL